MEDNFPYISVIIPVFNRLAFVGEAIESVMAQTYPHWELLVIDDASTDGTYLFLKEKYGGNSKIRVFRNEINRGVSYSRNKGILNSRYPWVAFLDSDDLWKKKKLEKQVAQIQKSGNLVCHTQELWYRNGEFLNQKKHHRKYGGRFFEKTLPLCLISPSSVMIHKLVFETIGLFDENYEVCEDYEMWLRLTLFFAVDFLEEPLLIKRGGHEDQLSHKYYGMDRWRIRALEKLLKSYDEFLSTSQKKAIYQQIIKKASIYANGARKRDKEKEALSYQAKADFYQQKLSSL